MDVGVVGMSGGLVLVWASSSEGVILVGSMAVEVWTRAVGGLETAEKKEATANVAKVMEV